ncbi:Cthe_2314 family HEPN domain-containing protein [Candidatus Oscillochloris fontis]|uniref:Cthe_2314 family HEPN domain-containing protein n=1 Tax=Candidatus Oscillochloris fontis TaxID=2496868 RepID=UPI00101BAB0D|nr:Cthe_2314 family HEPN domain-containing protein [Candidatus Oscillochloris fontis]
MSSDNTTNRSLYYDLLAHPLVIRVLENTSPLYDDILKNISNTSAKTKSEIQKKTREYLRNLASSDTDLSFKIKYNNEVFQYISNLTHAVERIEMTPIFFRRYPKSKTYEQNNISLHRWIQYHYASFLITITSIYDTALLLTNAVFLLGIEPKFCSHKKIIKHERIKETPVKPALEHLDALIEVYREPRHLYAHRSVLPTLDLLDDLESMRFASKTQEEFNTDMPASTHPIIVEELYQIERRRLTQTIKAGAIKITEGTKVFFSALHPFYTEISS